jgi:predicted esterase
MFARGRSVSLLIPLAAALISAPRPARAETGPPRWCAPELEALSESICYVSPSPHGLPLDGGTADAEPEEQRTRTLVIFLHPLVGVGSNWQWEQQRLFAKLAHVHHLSVLMPRGRADRTTKQGIMYTWPNSAKAQARYEQEVLDEWMQAKQRAEARDGRFDRVFVFGFSNGAYYASSLALRGRLRVDGYAVFAGGEALKYLRPVADKIEQRAPIFVGYGTKDPAHHDQEELIELLRSLRWPYRSRAAPVGHMVTNQQLDDALQFFGVLDSATSAQPATSVEKR